MNGLIVFVTSKGDYRSKIVEYFFGIVKERLTGVGAGAGAGVGAGAGAGAAGPLLGRHQGRNAGQSLKAEASLTFQMSVINW